MSKMKYLKPGNVLSIDGQKLLVKEGHCDDCFFSGTRASGGTYCKSKFKEGCGSVLGSKLIVIPLKEGL